MLLGIEAAPGQMKHHRVASLELREGPPPAGLVGEFVVGKQLAFTDVAAHVAAKLERVWSKDPTEVQHMFKSVAPVARSQKWPGGVDGSDMAARQPEVAKELPAHWIDLLGQQADLIGCTTGHEVSLGDQRTAFGGAILRVCNKNGCPRTAASVRETPSRARSLKAHFCRPD